MNQLKYRLKKRMYRLKARRKRGFGIHSPFVFHLLTSVIAEKAAYYAYEPLERQRKLCVDHLEELLHKAGSKSQAYQLLKREQKRVKSSKRIDQTIFRLVNHFGARSLYEIGGSSGISTAYLAKVDSRAIVHFVSETEPWHELAQKNWKELAIENINAFGLEEFEPKGPVDFLCFTKQMSSEALAGYWNRLKKGFHSGSLVVVSDIHRDSIRRDFWKMVKQEEAVRVSLDLFNIGILIFREELQKENFIIGY